MLEAFDRSLQKRAVLHNAYGCTEALTLNGVNQLKFSLPGDDAKAAHCQPFHFIHDGEGQYYRILLDGAKKKDYNELTYDAEHGIATLVDDLMPGTHIIGNTGQNTRWVIEYILSHQTVKRWRLGTCDFNKQFEYGFEFENLLNALFSVPNLFTEKYMWTYDMRTYPWTLHLLRLDEGRRPQFYIRDGKNLIAQNATRTSAEVCTRLYLRGYGEGDNQLTIKAVNGGREYLQSPQAYIDKYGLISKIYVDRQFEDAPSLMARGQALLAVAQEPQFARTFDVADLYELTGQAYDQAELGDLTQLEADGSTAFITGITRNLDVAGNMKLELSTTTMDIAANIADIADRQRIEQVYSQGATQIYAQSVQANATTTTAAELDFFIPQEMRIINKVVAKISLEAFRSYNKTTRGGGGTTQSSSEGGGSVTSTASGGGAAKTSGASGALQITSGPSTKETVSISTVWSQGSNNTQTEYASSRTDWMYDKTGAWNGSADSVVGHNHSMTHYHGGIDHRHNLYHAHLINHSHDISHTHTITAGSHSHSVEIPSHTHGMTIPAHSHSITIPAHTHEIEQGIFRYGSPTAASIRIGGKEIATMGRDIEIDLTSGLLGSGGKIPRGSWLRLGVLPNDLAHIKMSIYIQGFVQSRGGGTY